MWVLFNLKNQSLEVFALGMVDIDRVVGRLMQLVQDADVTATLCCCSKHGQTELVLVDSL